MELGLKRDRIEVVLLRIYLLFFFITSILLFASDGTAAAKSLKIGFGALHANYNAYPASNQKLKLTIPYPAFEFRTNRFRADNSGGIFRLLGGSTFGINVTIEGALPAASKNVMARAGMPDLELLGEIGPNLYLKFFRTAHFACRIDTAYHGVVSFGGKGSIVHRGYTLEPSATLAIFWEHFELSMTYGRINLDRKYAGYIYDVTSDQVLVDRPEYFAKAGELADRIQSSVIIDFHPVRLTLRQSYFDFKRSINRSGPLHLTDIGRNLYAGLTLLFEI